MGVNPRGMGEGIYPLLLLGTGGWTMLSSPPPLEMSEALAHLICITLSISMEKFDYNYFLMDFH